MTLSHTEYVAWLKTQGRKESPLGTFVDHGNVVFAYASHPAETDADVMAEVAWLVRAGKLRSSRFDVFRVMPQGITLIGGMVPT